MFHVKPNRRNLFLSSSHVKEGWAMASTQKSPDRQSAGTTVYVDRQGTKHYGVMARVVAEREGGSVTIQR